MVEQQLPDVALIGWPKCGTSSLFRWLDAHPDIVGSQPKEPNFFFDPNHPLCGRHGASFGENGLEAYGSFFPDPHGRLLLDGSVHTFYQTTAMSLFAQCANPPLLVAILRQPSERLYSSFQYTKETLAAIDRRLTFNVYVDALMSGNTEGIERSFISPNSLSTAMRELELGRYVEWLAQWQDIVGQQRLIVLLSEDLKFRPLYTLNKLCARLGVDASVYDDFGFQIANQSARPRSQKVHRLVRRFGHSFPETRIKSGLKLAYDRLQLDRVGQQYTESELAALARLDEYFAPWNARLAKLLGFDLSSWRVQR